MRRVAAELGTGAASLYRYLNSREDLLDLMTDTVGADYSLRAATGDWLSDLIDIGRQARALMSSHPWLAELVPRRPALGPNGLALLEHFLEVLIPHPADITAKVEAFGMLMAVTAVFVQAEQSGSAAREQRNAAYLHQALSSGEYPRLGELLARQTSPHPGTDRYPEIIGRVMAGLLGDATER
jgi:AcrR family transcriptional regulator